MELEIPFRILQDPGQWATKIPLDCSAVPRVFHFDFVGAFHIPLKKVAVPGRETRPGGAPDLHLFSRLEFSVEEQAQTNHLWCIGIHPVRYAAERVGFLDP